MWLAVCSWRSIVKGIGLSFFSAVHGLFENVVFAPELFYLFLSVHEVHVGVNFVVHVIFLLFLCQLLSASVNLNKERLDAMLDLGFSSFRSPDALLSFLKNRRKSDTTYCTSNVLFRSMRNKKRPRPVIGRGRTLYHLITSVRDTLLASLYISL